MKRFADKSKTGKSRTCVKP